MKSDPPNDISTNPHDPPLQWWRTHWHWLINPVAQSETVRRRARVLSIMLLILIVATALFLALILIQVQVHSPTITPYTALIGGMITFFLIAFGLNHLGKYELAASLTVAAVLLGAWVAIIVNNRLGVSDVFSFLYLLVSVLLCSILLSTRATIVLIVTQLIALLLLTHFVPSVSSLDFQSLVIFISFLSLLSAVSNFVSGQDLRQIELQTSELVKREALLRELSVRDALTGLYNRRYLEETLERELSRAARKQLPVGVIMIDIDHFKIYNDNYGHAAGDAVLHQLGEFLHRHVRGSDIACRYGGEEFTLILPEATRAVTRERAELVCKEALHVRVLFEGRVLHPITLSLGVAVFPADGSSAEAVLRSADSALYCAKRKGRGRVIAVDEMQPTERLPNPILRT
jgi:diguanylate cyclase (GGDEF)-like protein